MKPDYGYKLLQDGITPGVDLHFYNFRMSDFIVLDKGKFSTMANLPVNGKEYAVSFDFGEKELARMIEKAPPHIAKWLKRQAADLAPRATDLPEPISFTIRAHLGPLERNANEVYVPLIIEEIV